MGIKDKFLNFVAPADEDDEDEDETEEEETEEYTREEERPRSDTYEQTRNTKVKASSVSADTKMVLFEPRSFEEAQEIARHLKSRRAAVVNLHRLQRCCLCAGRYDPEDRPQCHSLHT